MHPAQVISRLPRAYPDYSCRVFQQATRRSMFAEGMARGQAKALDRHDEWIYQHGILIFQVLLAGEQSKRIAAAQGQRSQGKNPTGRAADLIAAGHALVPPEREGIHQEHSTRFEVGVQPSPL